MAEVFGTVMAAIEGFEIVLAIGKFLKRGVENARNFGDDATRLVIKMNVHQIRARQLRLLLFGELSEASIKDEKGQLQPCLFTHLPVDIMLTVSNSLRECQRVPERYQLLEKYGFGSSDIREAFGSETERRYNNAPCSEILKWSFRDKKKAVKMIAEYSEWVEDIYQLLLVYFLVKEHDADHLRALEDNKEANQLEIAKSLRLRRIVQSDVAIANNMVLNLELDMLHCTSFDGKSTCALHEGNFADEQVLLEFIDYTVDESAFQGVPDHIRAQVSRLTALLQSPKPREIRGLVARGSVHQPSKKRFTLIYDYPVNVANPTVVNLSELLHRHVTFRPTLTCRLVLAYQMALAVLNLHLVGWVHKNLRSSNIVFFRPGPDWSLTSKERLADPWLCGFEYSRPEANGAESWKLEDPNLLRNIYRHPDRWGNPTVTFERKHDIYALGVVLLEIGLWEPAVSFQSRGFEDWAEDKERVSQRILQHATSRLGFFAGELYQGVVLSCLRGRILTGDNLLSNQEEFKEHVVNELYSLCVSEGVDMLV